ncbi:MAG TPA: crossover junction endodeoxyribonuclease RuvC [Gemmatimonas sp.]|nr:crossover junction endodeoxyribonuclease RuvC [Gemmatimonas sp.]
MTPRLVLGIDPGTAVTGYGVVAMDGRVTTLVECGVIRTAAKQALAARLKDIHDGVSELIAHHRPDTIAVEDVFYARNVRTTVVLGHARGVILLAAQAAGLDIREYPPAAIKKTITGSGAASKEQVQFMVTRLLRLKSAPEPADAADGVAAALCACMAVTLPRISMPSINLGQRVVR